MLLRNVHKIIHFHTHLLSCCLSAFINPAAIRADVETVCSANNSQNMNTMQYSTHTISSYLPLWITPRLAALGLRGENLPTDLYLWVRMQYGIQSRISACMYSVPVFFSLPSDAEHEDTLQLDGKCEWCFWALMNSEYLYMCIQRHWSTQVEACTLE